MADTTPRRVIVTGGGRGIGRWVALAFAELGDRVALVGLEEGELKSVAEAVHDAGGQALVVPADLSDPEAPDAMVAAVDAAWGGVDVLVNNAARFDHQRPFWQYELSDWHDIVDVNLTGTFLCARGVARVMIRNGSGGRIVNMGAIQEWAPREGWSAYAATKGALSALTRAMALELAPMGIIVNAVAPGAIDVRDEPDLANPAASVLGRLGHPREVAALVAFLASDACSFVVGEVIRCDGGRVLLPRPHPYTQPDQESGTEEQQ